jgi:hypothetical protein
MIFVQYHRDSVCTSDLYLDLLKQIGFKVGRGQARTLWIPFEIPLGIDQDKIFLINNSGDSHHSLEINMANFKREN